MRNSIIILISALLCTELVFSQDEFTKKLLLLEQQAFVCNNDTNRNAIYLQKFDHYLQENKRNDDVMLEIKRVDYHMLRDNESKIRFLWNASVMSQLTNSVNQAVYYYSSYQEINPDTSTEACLLGALIYLASDSAIARSFVGRLIEKDNSFSCVSCLEEVVHYKKRNKGVYMISSAIIPGLGSAINGNVLKGTTSLLINGAAAYSVYLLIQSNLYFNAFFWGGALLTKFYIGNIKLTGTLFDRKESQKKNKLATNCELVLTDVLKKYPISFR